MKTKHIKLEYTVNGEDGNGFYNLYIDGKHIKKILLNLNNDSGNAELRTTIFEENISLKDYSDILGRIMEELSAAEVKDNSVSVTVDEVLPIKHNCSALTFNFLKPDNKNAILKIILHNECCCLPLKCHLDGKWDVADNFIEKLETFANKICVKPIALILYLARAIDTFNENNWEFCCYAAEA